ncbi:HlyC/CorC family transporter [Candidatus Nomurabacteria bacterium]|nr:HlyC/CorC family transporter [Candidatus Nomurabacteria bacterium]
MGLLIILVIVLIIGSGLFSGVEAALFAISQGQAEIFLQQQKKGAKALLEVKQNMNRAITVVVVGNNIVNIVGSIFVGVLAGDVLGNQWLGLVSALLTFLIIVLGEIIPKTIGENYAERISLTVAPLVLALTRILMPLVWFFEKITSPFSVERALVSEDELKILSDLGHREGVIEDDERAMIENVFRLNDLCARDIMTPRTVVNGLQKDLILGDIKEEIFTLTNSRVPVFGEDYDDIVGLCHRRDLLRAIAKDEHNRTVGEFAQPALYVSEKLRVDVLLPLFQRKREHLAIVKDEFDGTSGLVTLEDVLEQLVGEIVDETDEHIDTREQARQEAREINYRRDKEQSEEV